MTQKQIFVLALAFFLWGGASTFGQTYQYFYQFSDIGAPTVASVGNDILQTTDPKYVAIAGAMGTNTNASDIYVTKMKGNGMVSAWSKKYTGTVQNGGGEAFAITEIEGPDPGFVVAGRALSAGGNSNRAVFKVDPSGNPIWGRTAPEHSMIDVAKDPGSNIVFALGQGDWCGAGPCVTATYLAGIDQASGMVVWQWILRADINNPIDEFPVALDVDLSGRAIVVANTVDASGECAVAAFQVNNGGTPLFMGWYSYAGDDRELVAKDVAVSASGDYLVTSDMINTATGRHAIHIMMLNAATGGHFPSTSFVIDHPNPNGEFKAQNVLQQSGGRVLLTGAASAARGLLISLNPSLTAGIGRSYNPGLIGANEFLGIAELSNGNLGITGHVNGHTWLVRSDAAGATGCENSRNIVPEPIPLSEVSQGGLYAPLNPLVVEAFTATDIEWLREIECAFSPAPKRVEEAPLSHSGDFSLFPNPSRDRIGIRFEALQEKPARLLIYNMLGEKVMDLALEQGGSQREIGLEDLQKGLYWIEMRIDGQAVAGEKLILQ